MVEFGPQGPVFPERLPTGSCWRHAIETERLNLSVSSDTIRAELERILASEEFKSSKRSRDFLEFVVSRTLAGSSEELKERTIGIEVFGRSPTYQTSTDGIVRINASEVRKRLAIYYAAPSRWSECHISLPTGGYVPVFSAPANPAADAAIESSLSAPPRIPSDHTPVNRPSSTAAPNRNFQRKLWMLAFAVLLIAAIVFVRWREVRTPQTIVDAFWQPMFQGKVPIMIVPAYVPAYDAEAKPPSNRLTLLNDQFVGGGDLVAAVQISSMLARLGHPFNLRLDSNVSLYDLRNAPTVLIGYSSAQWTGITARFRFFVDDSDNGIIRDNGKPTDWYPHHLTPDLHASDDYAVISRAFDPETHAMLILVSGCLQYGTEGAAQLITNPELLTSALRHAPRGWQKKNLQLVVHFDLVDNVPVNPRVVASYYW